MPARSSLISSAVFYCTPAHCRVSPQTDCPWCEIRPSHAGAQFLSAQPATVKKERWVPGALVKGRNEPSLISHVLDVIAGCRGEDPDTVAAAAYANTIRLFFPDETGAA